MTSPGSARRPRADALRNRERLLAAAATAFTEVGANASLDDIARAAGVGNATLYRHFPTRQALIEAVYESQIETLCASARAARSPGQAETVLIDWVRRVVIHLTRTRGLREAFNDAHGLSDDGDSPQARSWHHRIEDAAEPLLLDAQRADAVRADLSIGELIELLGLIARSSLGSTDRIDRAMSLLFDGVRG